VNGLSFGQNGSDITYAYDSLNRLATVYDYSTLAATYDYDPAGSLESWRTPNGVAHQYLYDRVNRRKR
jgi:YD repeat-containing protein